MRDEAPGNGAIAFALIYFTFFLDNVLLTVLVPIIPDWVRGEALAAWAQHGAPLAGLLNATVARGAGAGAGGGAGWAQAAVGVVLGAKAGAQLACAPLAAAAVCRAGPARVLRYATMLLALAALVFTACSSSAAGAGAGGAWCACAGRAVHGAGSAGAGVGGLSLAAAALPAPARQRAMAALLGAVALGVLVGYPFGGAAYAMWSRGTPFLLVAAALLANVAMQYMFLDKEEYNMPSPVEPGRVAAGGAWSRGGAVWRAARRGAAGACAGAVLLTTSVLAALEPTLPLWIMDKFHPQRWVSGAVFVPDSAGYLVAATCAGGAARRAGAERVALCGVLAVGLGALAIPHATSVSWLVVPHVCVGCGLGAVDGALVPALVAGAGGARGWRVAASAALVQGAGAAAYAAGPLLAGAAAAAIGFETTMRTLATLNLLYAALLYRALRENPLSEQWGARAADEGSECESDTDSAASGSAERGELLALRPPAPAPAAR